MTAIPTGAHTLTITSKTACRFASGFNASCSCGSWRYLPREYTRQEARELHDAHLQAVLSEMEANDAGL